MDHEKEKTDHEKEKSVRTLGDEELASVAGGMMPLYEYEYRVLHRTQPD
jgi:hypothetical protein